MLDVLRLVRAERTSRQKNPKVIMNGSCIVFIGSDYTITAKVDKTGDIIFDSKPIIVKCEYMCKHIVEPFEQGIALKGILKESEEFCDMLTITLEDLPVFFNMAKKTTVKQLMFNQNEFAMKHLSKDIALFSVSDNTAHAIVVKDGSRLSYYSAPLDKFYFWGSSRQNWGVS